MRAIFKSVWVRKLIGKLGVPYNRRLRVRGSPHPLNYDADLSLPAADSNAFRNKDAASRYSPAEVVKAERTVINGMPDVSRITTSHVEKQNHTLRMHCRHLTRLTNAFSKKFENFQAAVALNFAYYNFCKTHKSLRMTPAQAAGIESSA
jgi:hypothetical protein